MTNDDVQSLIGDRDLVKSMIGNLTCISHDGARPIIEALQARAYDAAQGIARPWKVPGAAAAEVLAFLPPFPAQPQSHDWRYRVDSETRQRAWDVVDAATKIGPQRGRPVGSGEGRTARVGYATTPERKAKAERLAAAAGLTLAAWLDARIDSARG